MDNNTGEDSLKSTEEQERHLDQVFANAVWALGYGAQKEDLLSEIEEALQMHDDLRTEV
jgi:hypothetical protein